MDPLLFNIPEEIDLNEREDDDPPGLLCELKTYESRYNARGERVLLSVGSLQEKKIPRKMDHDSALVLTRYYDKERDLEHTILCVQSPHLKKALRTVIKKYPSVTLDGPVMITGLPKCLFHYRVELRKYADELYDRSEAEHVYFALRYMEQVIPDQLWNWHHGVDRWLDGQRQTNGTQNHKPNPKPGLSFDDLWMAFRPDCLLYSFLDGRERLWRLREMTQRKEFTIEHRPSWMLKAKTIVYDGENFGYEDRRFAIHPYEGHVPFTALRVYPLKYHDKKDEIMKRMVARGMKYVSLRGVHHQEYNGIGRGLSPFRQHTFCGEEDYFPLQSTLVSSVG
jgi:hypothetical protein